MTRTNSRGTTPEWFVSWRDQLIEAAASLGNFSKPKWSLSEFDDPVG